MAPKFLLQKKRETGQVQKIGTGIELHQNIQIALRPLLSSYKGTKDPSYISLVSLSDLTS